MTVVERVSSESDLNSEWWIYTSTKNKHLARRVSGHLSDTLDRFSMPCGCVTTQRPDF